MFHKIRSIAALKIRGRKSINRSIVGLTMLNQRHQNDFKRTCCSNPLGCLLCNGASADTLFLVETDKKCAPSIFFNAFTELCVKSK